MLLQKLHPAFTAATQNCHLELVRDCNRELKFFEDAALELSFVSRVAVVAPVGDKVYKLFQGGHLGTRQRQLPIP